MSAFDALYDRPDYRYGVRPNAFLVEAMARFAPGPGDGRPVIAAGDGEGRNGVWLAQQGFRVTAVDGSAVGVEKARRLARERGVEIDAYVADLATWTPPPASADAVALIFTHMPPAVRRAAHGHLLRALKPGGLVILEAFHPSQLGRPSGGPPDAAMMVDLEILRQDFGADDPEGAEPLLAWEGEVPLDEGPGHQGLGRVTRFVARKR